MHLLKFVHVLENCPPGQTTMLTRRAAKFCVEPRSPFSYVSHHHTKTLGKRLVIVSWPACRPELANDDDGGGGGFPRTLCIWYCPGSITRRDQISRAGNPSLRYFSANRPHTRTNEIEATDFLVGCQFPPMLLQNRLRLFRTKPERLRNDDIVEYV